MTSWNPLVKMESFVSELAQEARCSLCSDRLQEPKLLQCFHTYCKACIKRHAELQSDGGGNIFKCPECLAEASFPELNDVEATNPSPLHTRILKVLEFVESEKVCSVSKNHSTASWYCFDCNCSLCNDCQSYHSLFTKTDYNHEIVSLLSMKKEDVELMLAREDNCEDHVGYKLDFFCEDCKVCVCLVCATRDHRDHETIPSEKYSKTAHASLVNHLKTFDKQEQELSSHLRNLEEIAVRTRKEGERTIEEVKKKAKEIIERVQQKERELIQEIQGKIGKSEERKKEVQCILDQKKCKKRYITKMIERKLPPSKTKQIKEKMEVHACDTKIRDIQDDSHMTFIVSEECTRLLNAKLGTLVFKPKSEDNMQCAVCSVSYPHVQADDFASSKQRQFTQHCKESLKVRDKESSTKDIPISSARKIPIRKAIVVNDDKNSRSSQDAFEFQTQNYALPKKKEKELMDKVDASQMKSNATSQPNVQEHVQRKDECKQS